MNVPKLRFKEFNDEWILKTLKESAEFIQGINTAVDRLEYVKDGIKVLQANNIVLGVLNNDSLKYITDSEYENIIEKYKPKFGDVLYSNIGARMGYAVPFNIHEKVTFTWNVLRMIPNKDINNIFLSAQLNSPQIRNKVLSNASTNTMPFISGQDLKKIKLNFPSMTEQIKIGKTLELLDKKIELQSKKIEDLKLFKLSIKNNIFKSFDKEQRKSIEELLEFEQPTKYIVKSEEYTDNRDDIPVLTANKAFILGYCKEGDFYNKECIIFDDFTLDMKYVNFAFKVKSSAIKILTPKENINIKYIYEYMQFLNLHSEEHKRHYISIVQKIQIPVPIFEIQNKIATQLNCFDSKIELENNKLLKLTELKKGLMQSMFV